MIQSCRSFIYSTAYPTYYQGNIESLKLMMTANSERQALKNITDYFRKKCKDTIPLLGDTHIIPVQVGHEMRAGLVKTCRDNGFGFMGSIIRQFQKNKHVFVFHCDRPILKNIATPYLIV